MLRTACLIVLLLTVWACGGGGGTVTGGGGGGGGGTMTFAERQAVVKTVSDKFVSLANLSQDQQRTQFIAWANTQPSIRSAGITALGGNVYVQFADGTYYPILDNTGGGRPVPSTLAFGPGKRIPNLPQSVKAWTGHSLRGKPFTRRAGEINTWLGRNGYTSSVDDTVTVEEIQSAWNGAGVVYWEAHVGSVYLKDQIEGMVLLTDEKSTEARDTALKPYIDKYEVAYGGFVVYDETGKQVRVEDCYAITTTFLTNRVKFASNALVAIMGCTSADVSIWNAMRTAGAGTYVGNNALASGAMADQYARFFDRLLGENMEPPFEDPEQRPFNAPQVQQWMQDKGYDLDPRTTIPRARMTWYYRSGQEAFILKPTIYRVLVEAEGQGQNFKKWLIEGDFGPDQGPSKSIVKWAGVQQQVHEWTPGYIIIRIPKATPYPQGSIQVITQDRESNLVPMTEWSVPFTYTLTGKGTLKQEIKGTLRFRGDVRPNRQEPGKLERTVPTVFVNLSDSTATVTASGSYKQGDTTTTWSGTRTIKSLDVGGSGLNQITFGGALNKQSMTIEQVSFTANGAFTVTTKSGTSTTTATSYAVFDGIPFQFTLNLTPGTYVLQAKTLPGTNIANQLAVSSSLVISSAAPVFPPSSLTQSRPHP